ncbi:MAG: hypothetical protein FJX75_14795 [Armatimonadetes bacterium]|nr:hypothetical protein [Armatimonadota bacterium]
MSRSLSHCGPALALALLAAAIASADPWAPGTVWPARAPVRIEAEISRSDLWEWVRTDGGEWIGEWSDADATDFLRAAAHALGTELGDVEEALALRDGVERTGDTFRVTVVGRHAIWLAERADILRSSELLKRAARVRADVGWAVGNDAADRLASNRAVARIARGEWTSVREMAEQLETLAALDPGWLFRPYPAFDAWLAGPGRNVRDVRVLEALHALGVYTDPDHGPYAAWNPAARDWGPVLLFQGQVHEGGRPLPEATAIVRLANADRAPAEDQGRLDAVATGPDGTFLLALRGAQADRYSRTTDTEFYVGANKWGYQWVRGTVKAGRTQVTEVGPIKLQRSGEGAPLESRDLLLDAPAGYRTLTQWVTDDRGEERFNLSRTRPLTGSRRAFTSSSDLDYTFRRADSGDSASAWLNWALDTDAAQRLRRTPSTRRIDARVLDRQSDRGAILVTESGERRLDDGTMIYHTSEVRLFAAAIGPWRVRLQSTAIGTSNRSGDPDPWRFLPSGRDAFDSLRTQIEQRLATPTSIVRRVDLRGDWLSAEHLTRLYANVLRLQSGSVQLDTGEFDSITRHMPLARQTIRIEGDPLTFILGDDVQVTGEPGSTLRFSQDGRLRLLTGRFRLRTPPPNAETDNHLQHLGWLIFQAQQDQEDFAQSVDRAVRLGHISAAYGSELLTLNRDSTLRSLFNTCSWLATDDMLLIDARAPLLCFGDADLRLDEGDTTTLTCLSGRAFLGEESFVGLARLQAGETSTSRPGQQPIQPGTG